jgi:hypothetical protein
MLKRLAFLFLSVGALSFMQATTLVVSGSGKFSATDTADSLVTPGDTFSLSFLVPSTLTISSSNSTTTSFDVPIINFEYSLNGATVAATPTEVTFYTGAGGGDFAVQFASAEFLFSGAQLFSGTTTAPTFATTSLSNQTFIFFDNNNVDSGTATAAVSLTPEPSSLLLLFCGGILCAVGIRKSARVS